MKTRLYLCLFCICNILLLVGCQNTFQPQKVDRLEIGTVYQSDGEFKLVEGKRFVRMINESYFDSEEKLKELNIRKQNSEKLIEIFRSKEKVSCASLANYLNISERTANRLLLKLEENNLAVSDLVKINRGRPKIFFRFF